MAATLGTPANGGIPGEAVRFVHRFCGKGGGAALDVSIRLTGGRCAGNRAEAGLRAGARFLLDSARGTVAGDELARMIGCFAVYWAGAGDPAAEVALDAGQGPVAAARLRRPVFGLERNGFGAARILHESATLGLYVLEVAPGAAIPAHFHRVMQEHELVLDDGLLQQGRPVRAGDAFSWPAGLVHEYCNPTEALRRILCIDRPKFIPEDEVVVAESAELIPVAPRRNYLA